jgi:hypothetical protein
MHHVTDRATRSDTYTTRVRGDAALLGVLYGLDLSSGTTGIMPRLRLEMSYPDFGGGDSYSRLHRTSDVGLRQGFVRPEAVSRRASFP